MAGRIAASGVGLVACMGAYSMLMAEPARAQALTQEQKKTMRIRSHLSGAPRSFVRSRARMIAFMQHALLHIY